MVTLKDRQTSINFRLINPIQQCMVRIIRNSRVSLHKDKLFVSFHTVRLNITAVVLTTLEGRAWKKGPRFKSSKIFK